MCCSGKKQVTIIFECHEIIRLEQMVKNSERRIWSLQLCVSYSLRVKLCGKYKPKPSRTAFSRRAIVPSSNPGASDNIKQARNIEIKQRSSNIKSLLFRTLTPRSPHPTSTNLSPIATTIKRTYSSSECYQVCPSSRQPPSPAPPPSHWVHSAPTASRTASPTHPRSPPGTQQRTIR